MRHEDINSWEIGDWVVSDEGDSFGHLICVVESVFVAWILENEVPEIWLVWRAIECESGTVGEAVGVGAFCEIGDAQGSSHYFNRLDMFFRIFIVVRVQGQVVVAGDSKLSILRRCLRASSKFFCIRISRHAWIGSPQCKNYIDFWNWVGQTFPRMSRMRSHACRIE